MFLTLYTHHFDSDPKKKSMKGIKIKLENGKMYKTDILQKNEYLYMP